ncbi:putative ribonuclease H-like domain-containing protein [Tanacetum coccineum]|uniref:Ribonuclease H-like domain-containing protein n=1 Tax=Tanacetum coccineum TaxID=301880 RepID=A0ABQ5CL81_9ASTR
MNMLNRNCKTSFVKPEFLKKAQRENPRLYDIGCYNDNLALMLAPESDKTILDSLKSQLDTQKTQFLNEIDRLSREYYYADHMNAILGVYTTLDEFTNLQCDYVDQVVKFERLEKDFSKSNITSKSFEALQQHAIDLELALQQCQEQIKNDKAFKENQSKILPQNVKSILKNINVIAPGMYKVHTKPNQTRKPQLPQAIRKTNKRVSFFTGVIPTTSFSRAQLKSNQLEDRVLHNNSKGKKQQVEDHRSNFKFSNNKTSVTVCNDSLNAKTSNVKFVCATCGKCVLNDNHDMCVLHYINGVNSRTKMHVVVPISTREPKRTVNQSAATPLKRTVLLEIILFIVDYVCSKHMTGNLKLLSNFMEQFLGTMKFENDEIAPILGYEDLVQGKGNDLLTGSRVTDLYSITLQPTSTSNPIFLMAKATLSQAWLWHRRLSYLNFDTINLLSKYDIVTGLPKLKFVKDHLCSSYGIEHQTSTARTPEQNGVVERRNRTLVEAARTMLSAAKVPLFFWAEAIATTCFTQNHSLIIPQHEKTSYHIINGRKPSVKFFHIFGSLCYIFKDGENLDKMKGKGDACIFVGYSTKSRAYRVNNKRTRVIVETIHVNFDELPQVASDHVSSGPVPQCPTTTLEHVSLSPGPQSQENVPQTAETITTLNELDLLFSPMFDELLNAPVVSKSSAVTTADAPNQRQKQHTTLSTSTTIAADTHPLNIQTTLETTRETSSRYVDSSNMHTFYQQHPSEHCWTKDHPLEQVIRNPSQSIRTRRQLETYGEICMFTLTVSRTEPKIIKEAMADYAWIEAMQEELHQFDRLDVCELVDRPLCKNVINMKWLWKNKRDEENTVIRNKARLVSKGYSQQEGIDFEESFAPVA